MALNIAGMLRGRRQARAQGIEELARRLAAGEAVPPEEIETILERTGTDEDVLQSAVDRLERRAELLAAVARGNTAQAKADKIEGTITTAAEAVAEAQRKHAAVAVKHAEELLALRQAVDAADRANESLLDPENLSPADAARLTAAREAARVADQAVSDLQRRIPDMRRGLEEAEAYLVDTAEDARQARSRSDLQELKQRAENTVKARAERLQNAEAELPKLLADRDAATAALRAIEAELRR